MCRFAYSQEILIHLFFLGVMPLLNLEIWPKLNLLLKQFFSTTPLKLLNRILWNFVVDKYIPSTWAYSQKKTDLFIEWQISSSGWYLFDSEHPNVTQMWQLWISHVYPIITYFRLSFSVRLPSLVWHCHSLCAALSNNVGL